MAVRILAGDVRDETLAYCAGVIDSDGYIGVKRSTYAMRVTGDASQPTYSERVAVKQVQPQAIDLLKSLFGGFRGIEKPSVERGKVLHVWQVTDLRAAACLQALLPHLRIKREQAENCLRLRETKTESRKSRVAPNRGHMGAARRSQHHSDTMERQYARAKELNGVGRKEVSDGG